MDRKLAGFNGGERQDRRHFENISLKIKHYLLFCSLYFSFAVSVCCSTSLDHISLVLSSKKHPRIEGVKNAPFWGVLAISQPIPQL